VQHRFEAIFSTNGNDIWPSSRFGRTPKNERDSIDDIPYILDQLRRSLIARRMEGGRLFVNGEGAYWKQGTAGSTNKILFVSWCWRGDPPEKQKLPSYKELLASSAKSRTVNIPPKKNKIN
jgi:hypothetical protein